MNKQSLAKKLLALVLAFLLSGVLVLPVLAEEANGDEVPPCCVNEDAVECDEDCEDEDCECEFPNGEEPEEPADEDENGEDDEDEEQEDEEQEDEEDDYLDIEPVMEPVVHTLTVEVDGVEVVFVDQQPVNVGGTVLVPVRGVFELMGFTPAWSGTYRTATLTHADGTVVVIPMGEATFTVNGEVHTPPVAQQMMNGRVMLPLRAIAEALGATPDWCPDTLTAQIFTEAPAEPDPVDDEDEDYDEDEDENGDEEDVIEYSHPAEFVGTWAWEYAPDFWVYTFNADGTGILIVTTEDGEVLETAFIWVVVGNLVGIDFENFPLDWEGWDELTAWEFSFEDGILTLDDYVYILQ
ncbi:MAG: copper amine oxidase N-terminal domain-containing protein [Defluviitaleaceae bacterium]|nr:copper amine oxidase N-terminal domain-containing protein [Defluviitaleaceae bacterium]